MSNSKDPLTRVTVRIFESDRDLIRDTFPGGYGQPNSNEIIRGVIRKWCDEKLRSQLNQKKPDTTELDIQAI